MKALERDFEATISWVRWSDEDSTRRNRMLNPPLWDRLTVYHKAEVSRLRKFGPGDLVRSKSVLWLIEAYEQASATNKEKNKAHRQMCRDCGKKESVEGRTCCWRCQRERRTA
jgi:hypothetical protein